MSEYRTVVMRFKQCNEAGVCLGDNDGLEISVETQDAPDAVAPEKFLPEKLLQDNQIEAAIYEQDGPETSMYRVHAVNGNIFYHDGVGDEGDCVYGKYDHEGRHAFVKRCGPRTIRLEFAQAGRRATVTETLKGAPDAQMFYTFKDFRLL